MRYFFIIFVVTGIVSFASYIVAAEDFLQKKLKEDAQWHQVIARVSEIIEVTEDVMVYTEDPPKLVITLKAGTVTVTGSIARRAYEIAQHKKNLPSSEELLAFMRQFSGDKEGWKPF